MNIGAPLEHDAAREQSPVRFVRHSSLECFPHPVDDITHAGCTGQRYRKHGPTYYVAGDGFELGDFLIAHRHETRALGAGFLHMTTLKVPWKNNVRTLM